MSINEHERQDNAESSRELWRYVLFQAIADLARPKGSPNERRIQRESALFWFNSNDEAINSFIGICGTIGIDPDKTRAVILNKKRKGV